MIGLTWALFVAGGAYDRGQPMESEVRQHGAIDD